MAETTLAELLERNGQHTESLPEDYFDAVQDSQEPAAMSICCADSRVSQEGMWAVDEPGWLFTPSTIGNQVWDTHEGSRVMDGSVLYPLVHTGTETAVVVGHTGCGAVTAALDAVQSGAGDGPPGIGKWVELLVPVVEAGLVDDRVDPERDVSLVDQLVEYNVDRQVAFLRDAEEVPDSVTVYGFVYDFQQVYGETPGCAYLVNLDGTTVLDAMRDQVPAERADHVRRLLATD
jgi:carbonic anhydrase